MPAEAKTIEATKAIKKFTVTWVADGKTVETDRNVTYGSTPDYNGATPTKAPVKDESINYTYNYTYVGWTNKPATVTSNVTITAKFVTLKAKVNDGKQLSYTKNQATADDVKKDITVYVEDQDKNKSTVTTYTIKDFNASTLTNGNNRPLNIEYNYSNTVKLTNNQLTYEILRKAYNSKFEVRLNITNGYRETKNENCKENCDTDAATRFVDTGDYNVLEVIEHYNQFVEVKGITVNYGNGEKPLEFIEKYDRNKGRYVPDSVRWSEEVTWNGTTGLLNPVYIAKRKVQYIEGDAYTIKAEAGTIKHGNSFKGDELEYSYGTYYAKSGVCEAYSWFSPVDCNYTHKAVKATTIPTDGTKLYKYKEGWTSTYLEEYKPAEKYVNVDDKDNQIQTVTVTYHRDANPTDHESAGNFVVVFEYDRTTRTFICVDEHQI